ncbi:uncharacterized protein CMC5_054040 [Chondromyces crocatus]|nr:uncharacterized protein CMC5_054040 [Chondromyces crocatus]
MKRPGRRSMLGASAIPLVALFGLAACAPAPQVAAGAPVRTEASASPEAQSATTDRETLTGRARILADVPHLSPLLRTEGARRFLESTAVLPRVTPRTLFHDTDRKRYFTASEAAELPAGEREALQRREIDEEFYYTTRYGTPLSYARPLDLLFSRGLRLPQRARILDFGYGYSGHLRMLAALGHEVTGVDVDPLLRALYAQASDQGAVRGVDGAEGRFRLLHGRFPAEVDVVKEVGDGYDLILSKNVLKKGYIHPDRPAEERHLIRLGVPDEAVLAAFFRALRPSGQMLVYNICPAPSPPDKPFVPWSDGRSPFTRAQWEAAGFRVIAFDEDDTETMRTVGQALGWDRGEDAMDLVHDLSVLFTWVERPATSGG